MKKFYETSEFEALQAEWYKKLEKSGFTDIEQPLGSGHFIARMSRRDYDRQVSTQVQEYFDTACAFYHENEFASEIDRATWELHCAGLSIRQIGAQLKKLGFKKKTSFCRVRDCIIRTQNKMKGLK